jgi:hypothetical protein
MSFQGLTSTDSEEAYLLFKVFVGLLQF